MRDITFSTMSRAPSFCTFVLCPVLIDFPHPHRQLYQESDKRGLPGCHQSPSLRAERKESNICSCKCLPLSTPTPLHRHTIFTSSKPLFNSPPVEKDNEQIVEAAQALFFYMCVSVFTVYSSHTPWARPKRGCTWTGLWQSRPPPVEGWVITPALGLCQAGCGTERTHNTGGRWYTLRLILETENLEFLVSLLTTTTLDKSIPMATALSIRL